MKQLEEAIKILYEFGAKKEYTIGMCENLIEKKKETLIIKLS